MCAHSTLTPDMTHSPVLARLRTSGPTHDHTPGGWRTGGHEETLTEQSEQLTTVRSLSQRSRHKCLFVLNVKLNFNLLAPQSSHSDH